MVEWVRMGRGLTGKEEISFRQRFLPSGPRSTKVFIGVHIPLSRSRKKRELENKKASQMAVDGAPARLRVLCQRAAGGPLRHCA